MANEEVLGPRKTMFVLVIVVGCFAVLWPRILSPLITGPSGEQLKPNKFDREAAIKQERPLIRGAGPHPALRERGRAIPPGVPSSPTKSSVAMPPHVRPPPIPGMRPPLGSPGGPVPAPKSSMGFVMPIYTICIIVFFVYTISKILFRRTASSSPYETLPPDPQFRRRVFRDDSRSTPDKLVVTAISGLVAEVQQQMEASYAQNQQRQEAQDNNARPYTNGTILHNSGPVHIVASEYNEPTKGNLETQKEPSPAPEETKTVPEQDKEPSPEPEKKETVEEKQQPEKTEEHSESIDKEPAKEESLLQKDSSPEREPSPEPKESTPELKDQKEEEKELKEESPEKVVKQTDDTDELIKLVDDVKVERNGDVKHTEEFIKEEAKSSEAQKEKQSTPELLEEAIKDDDEQENASVKHEAEQVQSIYLETEIPQQSRVLVTDFAEKRTDRPAPTKHSPMVVSGKMTLSLIQDAPRDTPERDQESTVDDFTTASAVTQNAEKEDESEEEIEEEIEIEEIGEEVEEEEEEEEEGDQKDKKTE
ncbi:unnamed protein product [Spodoptera exigua]|nr:unnamed protein product [Spodoptera exigua]